MENRRQARIDSGVLVASSSLPISFTKSVIEVFSNHFENELKELKKLGFQARFKVSGEIYADEVVLAVSLMSQGQISATTVYASIDFDPAASYPKINDVLSVCVDGVGTVYGSLFGSTDSKALHALMDQSLQNVDGVPIEWEALEIDKKKLFIKVDKANPELDAATDAWLKKNDPQYEENKKIEQEETEKLFVTGVKKPPLN